MQSICSYLQEVEGRIFNALFSTAPKLANNECYPEEFTKTGSNTVDMTLYKIQ